MTRDECTTHMYPTRPALVSLSVISQIRLRVPKGDNMVEKQKFRLIKTRVGVLFFVALSRRRRKQTVPTEVPPVLIAASISLSALRRSRSIRRPSTGCPGFNPREGKGKSSLWKYDLSQEKQKYVSKRI